ncbi:hypothetical protein H8959_005634 [Pygathrix nigripes]
MHPRSRLPPLTDLASSGEEAEGSRPTPRARGRPRRGWRCHSRSVREGEHGRPASCRSRRPPGGDREVGALESPAQPLAWVISRALVPSRNKVRPVPGRRDRRAFLTGVLGKSEAAALVSREQPPQTPGFPPLCRCEAGIPVAPHQESSRALPHKLNHRCIQKRQRKCGALENIEQLLSALKEQWLRE